MSDGVQNENNGVVLGKEQSERLLSQGEVNNIVASRLARQEANLLEKFEKDISILKSSLPNEDAIASKVRLEIEAQNRKAQEEHQQSMFQTQFQRDKTQYGSLVKDIKLEAEEDRLGLFDPKNEQKYLPLQVVAGNLNMENTAEIMKELARNPRKLRELNSAAKEADWDYIKESFRDISDSLKENQAAFKERSKAAAPLSHLKASSGGSSNREMTIDDYRRDPSLYM